MSSQIYLIFCGIIKYINVTIGKNIKKCMELKSIYLPKNLTFIANAVFNNCSSLTDVYYEGTTDEWSSIVIQTDGFGGNNNTLLNAEKHYNTLY